MPISHTTDPRAIRTRKALQQAFITLLETKSYHRITVTDIAKTAGFARHTFYNHYETRDDILHHLIDTALDTFFASFIQWDFIIADPDMELKLFSSFFQIWRDNPEIVKILTQIEYDSILIDRLRTFFTRFFYERISQEIPHVEIELAKYIINFNAYSLLGIMEPWLQDGMRHPPEVMAAFMIQLIGANQRLKAVEKYKHIFK